MDDDKELEELKIRRDAAAAQVKVCAERAYADWDVAKDKLRDLARVSPSNAEAMIVEQPHHFGDPKPGATLWREDAHSAMAAALAEQRLNVQIKALDLKRKAHERRERERDDERTR